jgi:cytochrome c oxidase subunit 2
MHIHRLERLWMTFGVAMLLVFLATITTAALVDNLVPPSHIQAIDPTRVAQTPPFDHPGLRKLPDGSYEAYYIAQIFSFTPQRILVPRGAKVTFYATTPDVVHGFSIPLTGVNMMVVPGWVSSATHTFRDAGTYLLVCNEYCGAGHQQMATQIEVR